MENYCFIVKDSDMKEAILKQLLNKKYEVIIDKNIPENDLDCFVVWADGSRKCIFSKCDGGDNTIIITDANYEWFLKQI